MKAAATKSYLKVLAVLAVAAPLAALIGNGGWH